MDSSVELHYDHPIPTPRRLPPPLSRDDFHVAVFCALPHEANKVIAVFDIDWRKQAVSFGKAPNDFNMYTLGSIGRHNVVLVHLGRMGANEANAAAATMSRSFINISIAFVVGVCGIVPLHKQKEVMLGDCIISTAIVQYDFGSQYPQGYVRKPDVEDVLGRAGRAVSNFLALLRSQTDLAEDLATNLSIMQQQMPNLRAHYPLHGDFLFDPDYIHAHHNTRDLRCSDCVPESGVCRKSCQELHCDDEKVLRRRVEWHPPDVHFGRIGSANTVMKSGRHRDRLARSDDLLAFEMEGCGIWDHYPTVIIKSGCDYADSHKSPEWQEYASAVAACGFRTLLERLESEDTRPKNFTPPAMVLTSTSLINVQPRNLLPGIGQNSTITLNQETKKRTAEDDVLDRLAVSRNNNNPPTQNLSRLVAELRTNSHLLRNGKEYWSHMTESGHDIYCNLYDEICNTIPKIDIYGFAACLGSYLPEAPEILAKWKRFRYEPTDALPKPYTLALLYMLHVEHFTTEFAAERPQMNLYLLQILSSFDIWSKCLCGRDCNLTWNFASTNWGMSKGPIPKKGKCMLYDRYVEKEKYRLLPSGSKYTSNRSRHEREKSDQLKEKCYNQWLSEGRDALRGGLP